MGSSQESWHEMDRRPKADMPKCRHCSNRILLSESCKRVMIGLGCEFQKIKRFKPKDKRK